MTMTRKDYEAVAEVLRRAWPEGNQAKLDDPKVDGAELLDNLRHALAKRFAEGNPRFDRERFLAASDGIKAARLVAAVAKSTTSDLS